MSILMPAPPPSPEPQHEGVFTLKSLFNSAQRPGLPLEKPPKATQPASKLKASSNLPIHHSPRVKKHHANNSANDSRKRKSRGLEPNLFQQFQDGLEDTRFELSAEADRLLTETELELNKRIEEVESGFGNKLKLAIDHERLVFRPLADEQLYISNERGENQQTWSLGVRMNDFERIRLEEQRALEHLWKEWTKIQAEIVCLAVEVLGIDVVTTHEGYDEYPGLKENVVVAIRVHKDEKITYNRFRDDVKMVEKEADRVKEETLDALEAQEKAWKAKQQKTQKVINSALNNLVSQD